MSTKLILTAAERSRLSRFASTDFRGHEDGIVDTPRLSLQDSIYMNIPPDGLERRQRKEIIKTTLGHFWGEMTKYSDLILKYRKNIPSPYPIRPPDIKDLYYPGVPKFIIVDGVGSYYDKAQEFCRRGIFHFGFYVPDPAKNDGEINYVITQECIAFQSRPSNLFQYQTDLTFIIQYDDSGCPCNIQSIGPNTNLGITRDDTALKSQQGSDNIAPIQINAPNKYLLEKLAERGIHDESHPCILERLFVGLP